MKRIPLYIILAFVLLLVGCSESMEKDRGGYGDTGSGGSDDEGARDGSEETEDTGESEKFVLKATVTALSDKIEVEIIESDYAFGIYWVITSEETRFCSENGSAIEKADIKVGDTVEIVYGGQVMMSYPPQIVAREIRLK